MDINNLQTVDRNVVRGNPKIFPSRIFLHLNSPASKKVNFGNCATHSRTFDEALATAVVPYNCSRQNFLNCNKNYHTSYFETQFKTAT